MSYMWWHSYHTLSEGFTLMTLKCRVGILWDLVLDSSDTPGIVPVCMASCGGHNLLLLPPTASQTVCHLPVKYCVALQSQLIWKGSVGRQGCCEGQPTSSCLSSPPPPPKPMWEMTLMRLGLACVYLTNSSSSALVLRHQVNPPKGGLDAPVKEDHIHSGTKIQGKHWGKPGVSQPGSCAMPQPAALCALTWESLPSWIFRQINAHICIHI